jgi:PAS domain S-box-containing protein
VVREAHALKIEVGCGLGKGDDAFAAGAQAARQALSGVNQLSLSVVLAFASVRYDLEALLRGIHSAVGEATVLGATTAGEVCNGSQQESVVVVALASPHLDVRVGLGQGVSGNWRQAVVQATSAPEIRPFFSAQDDNDSTVWQELTRQGKAAFVLLFSPGNTRYADSRSYEILEELKRLSGRRMPIFGGSAADDWRMEGNYVLLGQRAHLDSVLVAVFETRLRFGTALAHGFRPSPRRAAVTRARGHEVLELDGQPAAEVYTRLAGATRQDLEGKHLTLATGQPVGSPNPYGQYRINAASYLTPGGGVRFSQPVPEGTALTIMEVNKDDVVVAGQEALRKAILRGGITAPALVLAFPCALRSRILGERREEEISGIVEMASGAPVVGFYSFGEQGLADDGVNRHNNEVITVLALGRKFSYAAQVALENERLHRQLEVSRASYQTLLDMMPDAVVAVNRELHITHWSPSAERLLGYRAEEMLGQPMNVLIYPETLEVDRETVRRNITEPISRQLPPTLVEVTVRRKDGSPILVEFLPAVNFHRQKYYCVGILHDVTERVRAEEALRRAHDGLERRVRERTVELEAANRALQAEIVERAQAEAALQEARRELELRVQERTAALATMLEAAQVVSSTLDLEKVLALIAEYMVKTVGVSGCTISRLDQQADAVVTWIEWRQDAPENTDEPGTAYPLDDYPATRAVLVSRQPMAVLTSDPGAEPTEVTLMQELDIVSLLMLPLVIGDRAIGLVELDDQFEREFTNAEIHLCQALANQAAVAIENAHLYRQAQQEIAERVRAEEQLKHYAAELERSNRGLQQFAYVASHDMQEPLRMITSYLQLLERRYKGQLDADADDFIAFAVDGAARMRALIQGLLAYSRVGTRRVPFEPTDCQAILEQVLSNLVIMVHESGAVVTYDPLPTVMADATQLTQLFQNLISNAVKFRGERRPEIHVEVRRQSHEWLFAVRDNGIGIQAQHFERIFLIFQRLHTQTEYAGTGIGLAICKRIVGRHGGQIWVESKPGEGSTFFFTLPERR